MVYPLCHSCPTEGLCISQRCHWGLHRNISTGSSQGTIIRSQLNQGFVTRRNIWFCYANSSIPRPRYLFCVKPQNWDWYSAVENTLRFTDDQIIIQKLKMAWSSLRLTYIKYILKIAVTQTKVMNFKWRKLLLVPKSLYMTNLYNKCHI